MVRRQTAAALVSIMIFLLACGGALGYSVQREIDLGEEASKEVLKEMPLSENERWQSDIEILGNRFLPHIRRKEIPYHFHVVQAKDTINAFALPGGHVYFTERMWGLMTPDERAAIMAHEITHCDQRHGVDMMLKAQQRMLWMLPLLILGGGGVAEAVMVGNLAINMRYSRKMEREADEEGIKLLHAAGFNPAAMVTSMKKLLYMESSVNRYEISSIFASHPDTTKRIDYLTQAALGMGAHREEMELKAVDDPARLGNIISTKSSLNLLHARTTVPLAYGRKVLIKKMLWDDDTQALTPKTVATATVLTPGKFPILTLERRDDYTYAEIMTGDGVYPAD